MNDHPPISTQRFFRPITLLAGVMLGLMLLAWAGMTVSRHNWHRDFQRFHPYIGPETNYQPTVAEMAAIVRSKCQSDQILVIVGGNSVFQGVGQPVEKLWTKHLQKLLGDRYCVVNLALRGASPTDGGAIAAEALRAEFPHQIYLANILPFTGASPAGNREYRYLMYEAYWNGWLLDFPSRDIMLRTHTDASGYHAASADYSKSGFLNAGLHFREFWNWWSYTHFFTVPSPITADINRAFKPRSRFMDQEPDFEAMPFQERFAQRFREAEMAITRATGDAYRIDRQGRRVFSERVLTEIRPSMECFPPQVRSRTLLVLSANSPFYVKQLTPDEQDRNSQAYADSVALWLELGYAATDYGPGFTKDDFGDRTHLTASGGRKLAERLAPKILSLAEQLGYPNP